MMFKPWVRHAVSAWLCCASSVFGGDAVGATPADPPDPRLQAVLARLTTGATLRVAAIGGSITTGYAAPVPAEQGWAALVARWLAEQAARRGAKIEFVNLGVSGTDSAAAVQRVKAQAVDAGVELVFVEFGVNDEWLDTRVRARSYEGLLRQLLKAPQHPAVVPLLLPQQGNQARGALATQRRIARHYGLQAVDFGQWAQARVERGELQWSALYGDEPIHPNGAGHQAIAEALIESLQSAMKGGAGAPPALAAPLDPVSTDFEQVRNLGRHELQPYWRRGFTAGSPVHPEWQRLGGAREGWTATSDDAEMALYVQGRHIGVFHVQAEGYRDLEAWVDEGPKVLVQGYQPQHKGYLGWAYTPVALDLDDAPHVLHVRMRRDQFAGSGRPASIVSVMTAGVLTPSRMAQRKVFAAEDDLSEELKLFDAQDRRLAYVGRFDEEMPLAPVAAWSGSEVRARFTGSRLALRLAGVEGNSYFNVSVDGRTHRLTLPTGKARDFVWPEPLGPGEHTLSLVKRSEGLLSRARFLGVLLARDGGLIAPPPARPLRLEFYGDSITAGACNGDPEQDQYEDLSTHDGSRAYGALVAQRLGGDYLGIAISGTGITRSWNEVLMPQVFDRVAPRRDAPVAPVGPRAPDLVLVNLGQNDHGWPASRGEPFPAEYGEQYLAFVQALRQRYPAAKLVLLQGGMTGWRNEPLLDRAWSQAVARLKAQDPKVWSYRFAADTDMHPRLDTHERMATELEAFLRKEVLR